jgi:hypothetical protein
MEKYKVRTEQGIYRVYDTETDKDITKDVPTIEIAQEIADDFNAMSNKDFRPIGGPDRRPN